MAISMLKIRRPLGRLIFNMGIAIPGKTVFLIETAPRWMPMRTELFKTWTATHPCFHWVQVFKYMTDKRMAIEISKHVFDIEPIFMNSLLIMWNLQYIKFGNLPSCYTEATWSYRQKYWQESSEHLSIFGSLIDWLYTNIVAYFQC